MAFPGLESGKFEGEKVIVNWVIQYKGFILRENEVKKCLNSHQVVIF